MMSQYQARVLGSIIALGSSLVAPEVTAESTPTFQKTISYIQEMVGKYGSVYEPEGNTRIGSAVEYESGFFCISNTIRNEVAPSMNVRGCTKLDQLDGEKVTYEPNHNWFVVRIPCKEQHNTCWSPDPYYAIYISEEEAADQISQAVVHAVGLFKPMTTLPDSEVLFR